METQLPTRDHIFISYRRDDARGASGRLYDWLRIGFGRQHVFRDVASIGVGKWRDKIDAALAQSAVCVAVIGPRWANADNLPRLHNDGDMVRHELVAALASDGLTMVPTLVEGADIPKAATLPTELLPLFDTWNARRVTEDGWEDDTRRLIAEIAEAARLSVGPILTRCCATPVQPSNASPNWSRSGSCNPGRWRPCAARLATWRASWRRRLRPSVVAWLPPSPPWHKATRWLPKTPSSANTRRKAVRPRRHAAPWPRPLATLPTWRCCAM